MHKKNGCFLGKIVLHNYDVQKLKKFKRSNVSIFKLFRKKHRRGNIGLILINKRGHVLCSVFTWHLNDYRKFSSESLEEHNVVLL